MTSPYLNWDPEHLLKELLYQPVIRRLLPYSKATARGDWSQRGLA